MEVPLVPSQGKMSKQHTVKLQIPHSDVDILVRWCYGNGHVTKMAATTYPDTGQPALLIGFIVTAFQAWEVQNLVTKKPNLNAKTNRTAVEIRQNSYKNKQTFNRKINNNINFR